MTPSGDGEQPSSGVWWDKLISPQRIFSCSACLTQVEWGGDASTDENGMNKNNAIVQHNDDRQQSSSSDDQLLLQNVNSLADEGSSVDVTSQQTSTVKDDGHMNHNLTLVIAEDVSHAHENKVDISPTFGSLTNGTRSDTDGMVEDTQCPICLEPMSDADLMYPLQCPSNCRYNFCVDCMSSLLKSSKDAYEMASDGSMRVKIHLNCPNCRASIKDTIEDIIQCRHKELQEREVDDGELSSKRIIKPSKSIEEKMDSIEFLDNKSTSRLKNRATAPAYIRHKRKNDLVEEFNSIPSPSLVRDHVLAAHANANEELVADSLFPSTLSHPFYSSSPPIAPLDTEVNNCPRQRSKSFEVKASPTSVMDDVFWSGDVKQNGSINEYNGTIQEVGNFCFKDKTTGAEDDFLATLELNWCCTPGDALDLSTDINRSALSDEGCGGYVDYLGTYHECRATTDRSRPRYSLEPCQGCVFRRSMYTGGDDDGNVQELYYDSDCGQQFAVNTWTALQKDKMIQKDEAAVSDTSKSTHSSIAIDRVREKAKERWRKRRNRHSRSMSEMILSSSPLRRTPGLFRSNSQLSIDNKDSRMLGSSTSLTPPRINSAPSSPTKSIHHRKQTDEDVHAQQQAYIYDYFSMRTGICSTMPAETGDYVQDALNSRWRLVWHNVASNGKSKSKSCEVWIERGYRRNRGEIVEPKLMWRELSQPDLQHGILGESTMNPYRVSLFALRRIVPVIDGDDWQRISFDGEKPYKVNSWKPMVKPNCMIAVRSSVGQDYLFEALCPEERDRIIHLWKMSTARLVSHAVVGNTDMMMQEYFNEEAIQGGLYASMITTSDGTT